MSEDCDAGYAHSDPIESEESLSWCTRCGQPTRWDGHQWVRDPAAEEEAW